jgi:hypothetical protein
MIFTTMADPAKTWCDRLSTAVMGAGVTPQGLSRDRPGEMPSLAQITHSEPP